MPYRKSPVIKPPWKGWVDSAPSSVLDATSFRQITNWMIRFNRLQPFPPSEQWEQNAELNGRLMFGRTYVDQQGFYHTIFVTDKGYSELIPAPPPPFSLSNVVWNTSIPAYTDSNLFSLAVYNNQLFFANGVTPIFMHKGDGHVYPIGPSTPTIPFLNPIGDFPGSCFFFGNLAGRLLAVNTIEPLASIIGSQNYPSRIRYCAVNNPLEWDATIDASAGVFNIADVEDQLTGFVTINQTGFAFRANGITAISATGSATIPFFLENFSIGPAGIGCFVPYTLSAYGVYACFVAQDDIYTFSGAAPNAIGGNAKKSIFKDLATASSTVFGQMIGSFGGFVDYLTYWLCIPQNNDTTTSIWIYHFDDSSWVNIQYPYGALRCISNVATA